MVYVGLNCKNFLVLTFKQISSWEFEKKEKQRKENGSCIYNLTKGLFGIFFAWQAEKKN